MRSHRAVLVLLCLLAFVGRTAAQPPEDKVRAKLIAQ